MWNTVETNVQQNKFFFPVFSCLSLAQINQFIDVNMPRAGSLELITGPLINVWNVTGQLNLRGIFRGD